MAYEYRFMVWVLHPLGFTIIFPKENSFSHFLSSSLVTKTLPKISLFLKGIKFAPRRANYFLLIFDPIDEEGENENGKVVFLESVLHSLGLNIVNAIFPLFQIQNQYR